MKRKIKINKKILSLALLIICSIEEKNNARKNLANNDYKVDYIITHAPHTRALKDISSSYNADDV